MSETKENDIFADVEDVSDNAIKNLNNMTIENDKNKLSKHIQHKIDKLNERMRYINYKFDDVKQSFRRYSILIIYLATLSTLMQAFTNTIDLSNINNLLLMNAIKFCPLVMSSLISLLATIIKFNKFEEKIENITRSTEKCIFTMGKLKGIKEELYFCTENAKLIQISNNYSSNVYKEYLDSNTSIEKQLVDTDYAKYQFKIAKNDIHCQKITIVKNNTIAMWAKKQHQFNSTTTAIQPQGNNSASGY